MIIPILLFITLLYASMAVGTEAISGQKERGTFSRILLTPMSRQNIVIAFTRGVFIRALIPALIIIIITFFIPPYSYSLAGFLPAVLMIVSLALFISALAVMISVMNDSVTSAQTAFLPVFFILVTVAVTCINGENRDSPAYGFIPVYGQFFGIGDAVNGNPDTVRAFVCSLLTILLAVLVVWISGRLLMTERFTVSIGSSEEGSVSTSKADKILNTLFGLLDVVFFPLMILSVYQFLAMIPVAAAYMRDPDYSGFIEDLSNVSGVADIVDKTMEILGIFMNDPRFLALMAVSYILIIVSCIRKAKGPANIGLTSQRLIPGYLTGIVLGSVMMSLVFGLLVMTGKASVRGTGFPSGQTLTFIFSILMWIPQGAAEEVMFRGYMMTRLKKLFSGRPRLGTFIGIFVSSVLFSVFHCFNGGFDVIALINIFLLAVLFALIYEKSGSIVITCAAHTMWNMLQGNFYGLSVSGNAAVPSILNVNYTGSSFGPEGTIETTAVVTIGIILFAVISLCRRASSRKT